jgi:hypothetical protein
MALPGGNDALALVFPLILDNAKMPVRDDEAWPLVLLRGMQEQASRARVASVLACTCRAVRARADTTVGDAARRSALGQQARAMRAVLNAIKRTPLASDCEAQAALTEQCGATFADRTSAAAWREYEAEVLAEMAQANATATRAAAVAANIATGGGADDDIAVPAHVMRFGGPAASFAGEEYERAYDEVFWLLEHGPDTTEVEAEEEKEESNKVVAALMRVALPLSIILVALLAVVARYFSRSHVEVVPQP